MLKFQPAVYLLSKNIINISKRSLFSDRFTFLEKFLKLRLNTVGKCEIEFQHEIQHATIPTLLNATYQWILTTSTKPGHIELLQQSLNRLHDNRSMIEHSQLAFQFDQLGQMTMRLFDHLELPEKALQVRTASMINQFLMMKQLK